ncbi:MAG: CAP domain-containing protein [bacterium]|nr:CAP domain-containing protein [bacterium]
MSLTKKIRHWFVPSRHNNHHPHIIRPYGLITIAVLILLVQVIFNFAVTGKFSVLGLSNNIDENSLTKLTNNERAKAGIAPLNINTTLSKAAKAKATDMLAKNYWSHYSPEGSSPWNFFQKSGYKYNFAGENLARNFSTSSGVMSGWMTSSGHKANILNPKYTDIGMAVVNGKMDGKDITLVVAFYGQPQGAENIATAASIGTNEQQANNSLQNTSEQVAGTQASSNESTPQAKNYSLLPPILSVNKTLGWGAKIIAIILLILTIIYINTHRVRRKNNTTHHPLTTIVPTLLLITAIIFLVVSSFGSVG